MKIFNKILASTISIAMALPFAVYAKEEKAPEVLFNETFNEYVTNETPDSIFTVATITSVADMGNGNKALRMHPSLQESLIRRNAGEFGSNYIIEVSLMTETTANGAICYSKGEKSASIALVRFKDNTLLTHDNKVIGGLRKGEFTKISIQVEASKYMSVYINDALVLSKWHMPKYIVGTGDITIKVAPDTEHSFYIDDFRMYKSTKMQELEESLYNPDTMTRLFGQNDNGDYTYFNSKQLDNQKGVYANLTANASTNSITLGRLDYHNPDRDDRIHMKKTTSDSCYLTVSMNRVGQGRDNNGSLSRRTYSHFLISGDFKIDKFGCKYLLSRVMDSTASAYSDIVTVSEKGVLSVLNKISVTKGINRGQWFNIKVAVDISEKLADVYINDELVAEDMELNQSIENFNSFRIYMSGMGQGEMYIDNLDVTGLVVPYENGVDTRTSIFSDNSVEKEFLKDKIAFHTYAEIMYKDSERQYIKPASYTQNGDYYVPEEYIKQITDEDLSPVSQYVEERNGVRYLPVIASAKEVMKKQVFYHEKTGIIVISDEKLNFDTENWVFLSERTVTNSTVLNDIDFLNSFLAYERPDNEQLCKDFTENLETATEHPRIMLSKEKIELLKSKYKTDEDFKTLTDAFLKKTEKAFSQEVASYKWNDTMRMNTYAESYYERVTNLGLAYHLTGERRYFERAWEDIYAIASFPDYNIASLLDPGIYNCTLAIGYDWFYDTMTPEQREFLGTTIIEHSLPDVVRNYYGRVRGRNGSDWSSFKWCSNICAVINSDLVTTACAVMERDPEFCSEIIKNALRGMEYPLMFFAPSGGWGEGMAYWNLTNRNIGPALMALISTFGSDYGLRKSQSYDQTVDYAISMFGPCGVNMLGDMSPITDTSYPSYGFLSELFGKSYAAKIRASELLGNINDINNLKYFNSVDIITYSFDEVQGNTLPNAMKIDGMEAYSYRADFSDKESLFFSTHFGPTSGYHLHNDTGTFVFDILGERWAEDFGKDDYNIENEMGYESYELYRKRAEGHNVIIFNEHPDSFEQIQKKIVPIADYTYNDYGGYVYADMSEVYEEVSNMMLGYYIGDNARSLTARYEMDVTNLSHAYWFMHTKADILIDRNTAILSQNGKSVIVKFETNGQNAKISRMEAQPLESSPQCPPQAKNEGYSKIAIEFDAQGETHLTIKVAPLGEGAALTPVMTTPISDWKLPVKNDAVKTEREEISVELFYDGTLIDDVVPVYNGRMPEITAKISKQGYTAEVINAENPQEYTMVKIYDEKHNIYCVQAVKYYAAVGAPINNFNELNIANVSASSWQDPNVAKNMIDGDFSTRWTCMALDEYAIIDLGKQTKLDAVALSFWKGNPRKYSFDILVSSDGVRYDAIYSGSSSGTTEKLEVYDFNSVNCRFIKLINRGNSTVGAGSVNCNILEIKALEKKH